MTGNSRIACWCGNSGLDLNLKILLGKDGRGYHRLKRSTIWSIVKLTCKSFKNIIVSVQAVWRPFQRSGTYFAQDVCVVAWTLLFHSQCWRCAAAQCSGSGGATPTGKARPQITPRKPQWMKTDLAQLKHFCVEKSFSFLCVKSLSAVTEQSYVIPPL